MKTASFFAAVAFAISLSSCQQENVNTFSSDTFKIEIDQTGFISGLLDAETNINYDPYGTRSPILGIVDNGRLCIPITFKPLDNTKFQLGFDQTETGVVLEIVQHPTHISFYIKEIDNDEELEAIIWGPYPTEIGEIIGENIGVVRNSDFAIGIQSLNPRTTAGKLDNIQGRTSYHGTAADSAEFGSTLQAFAIDRTKDRTKSTWERWENTQPGDPLIF